jgi:hypothetical protein
MDFEDMLDRKSQTFGSDSYLDNVRVLNSLQQQSRSQSLERQQQSQTMGVELNKLQ